MRTLAWFVIDTPMIHKAMWFVLLMPLHLAHANFADRIDAIVQKEVKEHNFQGNVFVHGPQGEIFARSYGLADIEFNVPNTRATKFRIGSVTKQFTATAVLKLLADKKIKSLQDPIVNYVTVPATWKGVTFHHLLTHTAGLAHDPTYTEPSAYHTLKQLSDSIVAMEPKPGSPYAYSNAGYELLADLVQEISGEGFEDYVLDHILRPAGLNDTSPDLDLMIVPNRARGYMFFQNNLVNAFGLDISITNGAGNFYSTVDDLFKWDQLLRGEQILPADVRDLLFQPHVPAGNPGQYYGYGWMIDQWRGHKLIWHNGAINGYVSDFARYVDDQLVIVSLSNRYDVGASLIRIREQVAQLVLLNGDKM